MEVLTHAEFRERAQPAYETVFAINDAYDQPFRPQIQPRLLLYRFQWGLEEPWLDPVVRALKAMGEDGFFLTALRWSETEDLIQPYHWYVPLEEISTYRSVVISRDNAFFSVNAHWGIICSEEHALVGGSMLLIDTIRSSVPDLDKREAEFLNLVKYYHERSKVDLSWLPTMLSHVYGAEKAERLLVHAQLDWLLSG